jgi:hypothetical protein
MHGIEADAKTRASFSVHALLESRHAREWMENHEMCGSSIENNYQVS